ncbi:hypothetical protein MMC12_006421 [Toensbergia leucococca]|nr:hypothetical protein [Toensbergia leucococca]
MAPQVLLLQLGSATEADIFKELYAEFRLTIEAKFTTAVARTDAAAFRALENSTPQAVLVVDAGLARQKSGNLQKRLAQFASDGGTVVLGCLFSSFVSPSDLNRLFKKRFGLPWKAGEYHRTTCTLNRTLQSVFGEHVFANLPNSYSMKATHLKDTSMTERVYAPSELSRTESLVFPPAKVDSQQCPAVFVKHGRGFFGYIGDVNNEAGSQTLILAMLDTAINSSLSITTAAMTIDTIARPSNYVDADVLNKNTDSLLLHDMPKGRLESSQEDVLEVQRGPKSEFVRTFKHIRF